MVQIKFTKFGANSLFGGFAPGESARLPADLAKHLVEEVECAAYVTAPVAAAPQPEAETPTVPAAESDAGEKPATKPKRSK